MIKISIVIPAYNVEDYIEDCINSLVAQSFKDIEIILVDDGSKDRTSEIINKIGKKDSRIKYIYQENKGIGKARNKGWEAALGEYIYFMDSDDLIHPYALEIMYNSAVKYNLNVVCGDYKVFYNNDMSFQNLSKIQFNSEVINLKVYNPIEFFKDNKYESMIWKYLYNKRFLDSLGYKFYNYVFEDCEFSHKTIFSLDKLGYIDFIFYYYRQREGGFCYSEIGRDRLVGSIELVENLKTFYDKTKMREEYLEYFACLVSTEMIRTVSYRNTYIRLIGKEIDNRIKRLLKFFLYSYKLKHKGIYFISRFNLNLASYILSKKINRSERKKRDKLFQKSKNL